METLDSNTLLRQFLSWLTQVLSPYLILMAGFLTVTGRGKRDFSGKTFKLGFEACILGVGIAAVLLGSHENHTAWQLALFAVVFGLFLIVGYGLLNESDIRPTRKARLSVFFSTFVFGANSVIHNLLNRPDEIRFAIWMGIISWIIPCSVFCLVVRDNKRPETTSVSSSPPPTSLEIKSTGIVS